MPGPAKPALQGLRLALGFAAQNVRTSWRRVLLAVLGVAIGIAAVASMLLIGHSVTAQASRAFERLGADVITIELPSHHNEAIAILQAMPEVQAVTRLAPLPNCAEATDQALSRAEIVAVAPGLAEILSLTLRQGRFLHPLDGAQPWVVLGADAFQAQRLAQPTLRLGEVMDLCGKAFRVAGVLAPYFGDDLMTAFKVNRALLVSHVAAGRLSASNGLHSLLLVRSGPRAEAGDLVEPLAARLRGALGKSVQAHGARQLNRVKQEQVRLYTRFLAVLGSVALLVGSLGITNVMLVSVSERRAEIGLRIAVGASALDVVLQFLVESVLICLGGALLGVVLGTLGASIALSMVQIEVAVDLATPLLAAMLAVLCGLGAGAYPALRAARLDPVSTLQGQG